MEMEIAIPVLWGWQRAREWLGGNGRELQHYIFPLVTKRKLTSLCNTYTIGRKTGIEKVTKFRHLYFKFRPNFQLFLYQKDPILC